MELFKLLGTIAIDTKDMERAFKRAREDGSATEKHLSSAFSKMGTAAVALGTTVAAGIAAGTAAVAGLVTASVNAYADYEQLSGGVETLFKDSADVLEGYADKAFMTAGLSANEYMETATSFAASLIQGLGGDTEKAAEYANMAITDMSDNANKMGTDIGMIQNAYQGFAKQNYTMLDNLKLGYGGTQSEMERLLKDADALSDSFNLQVDASGNLVYSYADVCDAIHIVQTEMGITGTTAKEAEATISGSIAMTKSAWENLMSGLAQDNADIPALVGNVISSGTKVLENIVPVAKRVLENIPLAIAEISPEAGAMAQTLVDAIIGAFDLLAGAIEPTFALITDIFNFLSQNTWILTTMATAIGVIVTAITMYNAVAAIKAAMAAAEVTTIWGLVAAYAAQAVAMAAALAPYLLIAAAIAAVIAIGVALYKNWDVIKAKATELWQNLVTKFTEIKEAVVGKVTELKDAAVEKFNSLKDSAKEKFQSIKDTMGTLMEAAKQTVSQKLNNIKSAYESHGGGIKGVVAATLEGIKGYYSAGFSFIDNLTGGKLSAIVSKFKEKMNAARDAVKSAIDKIKGFFNFSWSLPKIKLPHISISGKFSLDPPSVPKFSISWYKKAMENAMILNSPTIFGYSGKSGKFLGGGEAGSEVVAGSQTLMGMIQGAVAEQNGAMADRLDALVDVITRYLPEIAMNSERQFVFDTGATAGALAPAMDRELGRLSSRKDRGR